MLKRNEAVRLVAVLTMLVLALGACAGTSGPSPTVATSQTPGASGPAPTDAPTGQPTGEPTGEPTDEPEPTASAAPTFVPGTGDIRWFCCLGTGEDPEAQVPVEQAIAADFSTAHPGTTMSFEVITYDAARDTLSTMIAAENAPQLVGPVGVGGIEAYHGQWLDLGPYIESAGFDLSAYPETLVNFYQQEDGQIGIPFAVYPSMLWYNRDLFDEAELPYPPSEYGAPYVMPDGTERAWDYETVRELAQFLTVDANGNDGTSPDFDPDNIVQWGFEPQRDLLAGLGSYFGSGSLVSADGSAQVPDAWADGWKYFYNGMWTDHFIMTGPQFDDIAPDAGGYAFFSGRVAMSTNFLWTTYGVGEGSGVEGAWDLAPVPSHNGNTTAPLNADTFVIHESAADPDSAFQALTYLQVDRGAELLDIYGGLPARTEEQDAFLAGQADAFPHDVNWRVVKDSLNYPDNPNFEAFKPAYSETDAILATYSSRWTTTPGLDLDAEIAALEAEIQAAWDANP